MKTEIKKVLYRFLQDGISSDDAVQQILDLFAVNCRLFTIKYRSAFAVFDDREITIQAKDQKEALDKFWNGKNKENWNITSVTLNGS